MLNYTQAKEWIREAGQLAMEYFREVKPSMKDNKTYVTEADLAVQKFLKEKIDKHYPDVGILAEEENLIRRPKDSEIYFVIDPIDGTAAFVSGLPVWGIAFGIIKSKKPIAGYFFMPATGDFYYTETDGPVYRNETETRLKPFEGIHRESVLLTISRMHQKFDVNPNYPGKIRNLGSTIAHICYAATNSADVVFISGARLWDLAAGIAMLYRNGGTARYINGDDFMISDDLLSRCSLAMPILLGQESSIQYFIDNIKQR